MLGVLVVRSVGVFASNAGMYNDRLVQIVDNTFALVDALERAMHSTNSSEYRDSQQWWALQ